MRLPTMLATACLGAGLILAGQAAAADPVDVGRVDVKQVLAKHPDLGRGFDLALIGVPAGYAGFDRPFYGTLTEFKRAAAPESRPLPLVLYAEGSGPLSKAKTFREWVVEDAKMLFLAPDSYAIKDRPTYESPVPKALYEEVHTLRQAEIIMALSRLPEIGFADKQKLFLMGNSEGALAAARYAGPEFIGRIVLSWTCEPGYFTDLPKVGANWQTDPFLNIVGAEDAFFSPRNPWNNGYNNKGHCADALFRFKNAKVVILPTTGHDVMANPYTRGEIADFLNRWRDGRGK